MAYWDYSLMEFIGFIVSFFSLPILGFLAGRHHTIARLSGERDREAEVRNIHDLIQQNSDNTAEQVRTIYQVIEQFQNSNSRTTT